MSNPTYLPQVSLPLLYTTCVDDVANWHDFAPDRFVLMHHWVRFSDNCKTITYSVLFHMSIKSYVKTRLTGNGSLLANYGLFFLWLSHILDLVHFVFAIPMTI